jgi:hypothetical protein
MPKHTPPPEPIDPAADLHNWITPEQFAHEFPLIASTQAVMRDVWRRDELGLTERGAVRHVGRRYLVHRLRYAEYRLEEHKPPKE